MKKFSLNPRAVCFILAIAFGLVSLGMIFAPAAISPYVLYDSYAWFSGFALAFGCKHARLDYPAFHPSFNICTYVLLLSALVLAVVSLFGKGGKVLPAIAASAFLIAGILYIFALPISIYSPLPFSSFSPDYEKARFSTGYGSVVGCIFALVAALLTVLPIFLKMKRLKS